MPAVHPTIKSNNNRILHILIYLLVLILLLPGCGSGGGNNPAVPPINQGDDVTDTPSLTAATEYPGSVPGQNGGKAIWGVWDVSFDRGSGIQVVPLRGVEYSLNVNTFLQPPMGSLDSLGINMINMEKLFIAGDCVVDVSLSHPFPQASQFTGFDVLGVVIGTGSFVANSDAGIIYANPDVDPILRNADGYTRWMNQMEFTTEGILGYTEGALGNKYQFWGSTLNPFKYFATNLLTTERIVHHYESGMALNQRGMFSTESTNTRRYELHFPMIDGFPVVKFQYAVVASWAEPVNNPPQSLPGDFPAAANMQEAFHCDISTVGSSIYWNNMYDNGGDLFLTLEIFDWQGMTNSTGVSGEIKQIILDSPDEFINHGSKMVFNSGNWTELPGTCSNSIQLALDVGTVKPGGPCPFDNDVLVTIVTAEGSDYDNGLNGAYPTSAVLSGYARLFYDMGNVCNDPPVLWFTNCPTGSVSTANRTFRWDAEDDVTPNSQLQYKYKLDSEAWSDWEDNVKQIYYENMTEEQHTVWVECRDLDGQISQAKCTFTIDLPPEPQPPSVEFSNCTAFVRESPHTFNLDISDDFTPLSNMKVRYSFEGAPWVNLPDGSTSVTLNGLVTGGPFQLIVEIEDHHEMTDQASCEFDVNFRPTVTIDNCPPLDLNVNSHNFTWTGVDIEMDALEYQTMLDIGVWSGWGVATNLNLVGLTSGNHVFYVRVRDTTGGISQTQCNFSVNFGPSITITNPPSQDVNSVSYTFNWNATDDLDSPLTMDYNVELDGVWQGWQTGIINYNWNPLSSGPHTIRVRVRDSGNPALWAEDTCNFNVNFKPSVSIDNCPPGIWASSDITFNWTGTDDNTPEAGMDYAYQLDGNPWSAWQLGLLTVDLSGLGDTNHTFSVRVRDTGTPVLTCEIPPDTCDSCIFVINASCAIPPNDVQNFSASDANLLLNGREVELTWTANGGCVDWYDIERYEYDWVTGWGWVPLQSVLHPTTSWIDPNARYSGPADPINYRIVATNISGSSPTWATDTGYPVMRQVKMALWCVADDNMGANPATGWPRGAADWADCNTFWNAYGLNFDPQNIGNFFWIPDNTYRHLTGAEDNAMHSAYGLITFPDAINVYYVESSEGNFARGYCKCACPGTFHNTQNVFIVLCRDTRGIFPADNPIVLAHECGHGVGRFWDQYLLDTNGNQILDDGTSCAADNTWCTGPPPSIPWLFCDDNACYPLIGDPAIPKQLMWYSYIGSPISDYDLYETQWIWFDDWVHANEGNYPYP